MSSSRTLDQKEFTPKAPMTNLKAFLGDFFLLFFRGRAFNVNCPLFSDKKLEFCMLHLCLML